MSEVKLGKIKKIRILFSLLIITASNFALAIEKADRVVVVKSSKTLSLYKNQKLIRSFDVVFGANPIGHKRKEGDERTPEGRYTLDFKKPNSAFYKAIHISYPNAKDIESAKSRGISAGDSIMIHGQKNHLGWLSFISQHFNWTNGCVALTNEDMDLVWKAVDAGTPIELKP